MRDLPRLGLGISSNLGASDVPQPYELLGRAEGAFDFLEYSAPLELDEARRDAALFGTMFERRGRTPVLFHPVHLNLWGPELEPRDALRALNEHARAVGSPWVGNDVAWWHTRGRQFPGYIYVAPPMTEQGLGRALQHVEHVQSALDVPLAIENPTVFARRGPLHVLDFMARLHARTGAPLIVDVGHLLSYQLAYGLPLDSAFDGFPWDKVIELHIAGGAITRRDGRAFYADDHRQPICEDAWQLLAKILPRCASLCALTYECDGHPGWLTLKNLGRLRTMMRLEPIATTTTTEPPGPIGEALDEPWIVHEIAHGARSGEDRAGDAAEIEYRSAVIAEELDRVTPLTRALLATKLEAFIASPGLKSRTLLDAWALFVSQHDEIVRRVFAVESWATTRPSARSSGDKRYTTPPHIAFGFADYDLTELQHARTMLDKHLVGRARASGEYARSALSAVREAAERAPREPWPVVIERRRGNVELIGVGADMIALLESASRGWSADDLEHHRAERSALVAVAIRRGWLIER